MHEGKEELMVSGGWGMSSCLIWTEDGWKTSETNFYRCNFVSFNHNSAQPRDQRDQVLIFETESETGIFRVSITRPSPRLKSSKSQFRERV